MKPIRQGGSGTMTPVATARSGPADTPAGPGAVPSRRSVLGAASPAAGAALLGACGQAAGPSGSVGKQGLFRTKTVLRYQSYKNPEELAVFQQGVQRWAERIGNVEVQT